MRILDRYIRNAVITTTFLVCLVITAIQLFLSLVQEFQHIGQGHYTLWKALMFVAMQLPSEVYQLFPMGAFLGAMIGLARLSSSSQLMVMRASGVSITRITWSVLKAAVLMITVMTLLGEYAGPQWQLQSEKNRQEALYSSPTSATLQSIWLHDQNNFTHIKQLKNNQEMIRVVHFKFGANKQLDSATHAAFAQLINNRWELFNLKTTVFHSQHTQVKLKKTAHLSIPFQPKLEIEMRVVSGEQMLTALYHTIQYRRAMGLSVNQFIFSFYQRLLQPITSLILIGLAVPFVFGSFRSTSIAMRIMLGIVLGFLFYILNQVFGPISLVFQLPPLLAAIMPSAFFLIILLVCLLMMR